MHVCLPMHNACCAWLLWVLVIATANVVHIGHTYVRPSCGLCSEDFISGLPGALLANLSRNFEMPNAHRFGGVVVCHSPPDAWVPSKFAGWDALAPCPPSGAHRIVGRTMFETDSLPSGWVARCESMDAVWVPTEFHAHAFAAAGVSADKLRVLGEPVDTNFFDPTKAAPLTLPLIEPSSGAVPQRGGVTEISGTPFRFLAVFKWELRKGWDVLLGAYFSEFAPSEHVELLLKTTAFHSSSDFDGLVDAFAVEHGLPAAATDRPTVRIMCLAHMHVHEVLICDALGMHALLQRISVPLAFSDNTFACSGGSCHLVMRRVLHRVPCHVMCIMCAHVCKCRPV